MRKRIIMAGALAAAFIFAAVPAAPAFAETYNSGDWHVTFTRENAMDANFGAKDIDQMASNMQPGDDMDIQVAIKNDNSAVTDWYLSNKVIASLEDASKTAAGGAYAYKLSYTGPDGTDVLFDSDTVGASGSDEAGTGLNEATNAMEGYFFLDTLKKGEEGKVSLYVALDGETQGNSYQDTHASLQLDFAVETDTGETETTSGTKVGPVKTGDLNTNMFFAYGAMLAGGFAIIALMAKSRKEERHD